jgi:hypothetical protein
LGGGESQEALERSGSKEGRKKEQGRRASLGRRREKKKNERTTMGKRGERQSERTLVCVIQALMGLELLVELRNDLSIRGFLDDCDNAMK